MRRPVKPFITEYKGSNRRPHGLSGDAVAAERATPQERVFSSERDRFATKGSDSPARPESEDTYEAAMRAADALFARRPAAEEPRPAPVSLDADQVFAPKPEPAATVDERAPERGGRILPALDEAPPTHMAALDEDRAPKRRGRKPGSKNKPRPIAVAPSTLMDHTPAPAPRAAEAPIALARAETAAAAGPRSGDTLTRRPRRPLESAEAFIEARVAVPSGRLRFSWLDRKLKPGEFWKRRLPKVCW